jgi:hypothetical protein
MEADEMMCIIRECEDLKKERDDLKKEVEDLKKENLVQQLAFGKKILELFKHDMDARDDLNE